MFQLRFLGTGSALNATRGNTAAFFIIKQELFLLDCGSTVVAELDRRDLFRGIKAIHVIITHCHCDHIGSLADLIYYAKYRYKIPLDVLWDSKYERPEHRPEQVLGYLRYFDVKKHCALTDVNQYCNFDSLESIHLLPTTHDPDLFCVSVVIQSQGESIFYSGDTNTLQVLKLAEKKYGPMEQIYFEICSGDSASHMYLNRLAEFFPRQERRRVTVMHFDCDEVADQAWKMWFQLPSS